MRIQLKTYYPGASVLHKADTRLKIILLALATVGLFLVSSLPAMAVCACAVILLAVLSRVPAHAYVRFLPMAVVFALLPVVFNGFALDVYTAQENLSTYYGVDTAGLDPIALVGSFGLVPAGLAHGAVLGLRIALLVYLSLLFTFTTDGEDVVKAITWFLAPLAALKVPVRDIAMVFSLALRFIPLIAHELSLVADAHRARGAHLDDGSIVERMQAWGNVFVPLFVRLFRQADALGTAMDARCYGMKEP